MVNFGLDKLGLQEIPGPLSNPEIIMMARVAGVSNQYNNDDIAWCGLFIAYVVISSGRKPVEGPLWARNWAKWGVAADTPKLGDILVFERQGGGGHVGLYIAEDNEGFYVLGGNQSNSVSITRIKKSRLLAARRPEYKLAPDSVKKYFLDASGSFSENEA